MSRRHLELIASKTDLAMRTGMIGKYPIKEMLKTSIAQTRYYTTKEINSVHRTTFNEGYTLPAFDNPRFTFEKSFIVAAMAQTVASNPHEHVAALNFASYKKPGGGWLSGANAQEESIARASGLVATLDTLDVKPFYETEKVSSKSPLHNEQLRNGVIFSPVVPIFMDDKGQVHEPYACSIITAAAVNCNSRSVKHNLSQLEITAIMDIRIRNVLTVALHNNVSILLLGAWGTGVFGNSAEEIGSLFSYHLHRNFSNCFMEVKFVIPDDKTMTAFKVGFDRNSPKSQTTLLVE